MLDRQPHISDEIPYNLAQIAGDCHRVRCREFVDKLDRNSICAVYLPLISWIFYRIVLAVRVATERRSSEVFRLFVFICV